MTRMWWLALGRAVGAGAALVAVGCGPAGEAPVSGPLAGRTVTFSLSVAEDERPGVQAVLQRFTQASGARVTLVSVTAEDLPQKLKVEVRAGRPTIDLFAQDNLALRVLVDEDLVADVSDVPIPDAVLRPMIPERFAGRQYFLPFRPNVQVAYVNRRRFTQAGVAPPTTVDELRAVGRQLKAAAGGIARVTLPLAEGAPAAVTIAEWIVGFGGDPLVLNDQGSIQAFEFLRALWAEGLLLQESLRAKYDTQVDFLVGETAWLAPNWPFTSSVLAEQGLLEFFRVYEGWRGPRRGAHVIGGDVLGIPKGVAGPRREAAIALAAFLMDREAQQILVERNGWPSVRSDAYATVPAAQRETFAAIQAALRDGWFRPNVPYWSDVSEAMNEAVRRILERGEPPTPVLDALHERVAAAARRRGAPYPPARP
jgi:trehalose transport system substrate-binding protein